MTNLHERIQQYLDGDLTGEELQGFEQALQTDRALAEELALMQEVRNAVNFNQEIKGKEERLKGTFSEMSEKYFKTESTEKIDPPIMPIRRILAVAASVLLLVGLGSFWWANQRFSAQSLAKTFMERPISDTNMGQDDIATTLKDAKVAYFAQDYSNAKTLFKELKDKESQLFLAYIAMEEGQFELAINQFTELLDEDLNELPPAQQDANKLRWNRLLAYLGSGQMDTDFFKSELTYFLNGKSDFYRQKASAVEQDLESTWRRLVLE